MRIVFASIFAFFLAFSAQAQVTSAVDWEMSKEKVSEGVYDLYFTANVKPGWYIYSQFLESDEGPVATIFEFEELNGAKLDGKTTEKGKATKYYDEIFEMNLVKYSGKVVFKQRVKVKAGQEIVGYLTYMSCDVNRCLPPEDVDFDFSF